MTPTPDVTATLSFEEDDAAPRVSNAIPSLVIAFHGERPVEPPLRMLLAGLAEVRIGRGTGPTVIERSSTDAVRLLIPDRRLSAEHACLRASGDGWQVTDLGSKNGTFLGRARCDTSNLVDRAVLELGTTMFVYRQAAVVAPARGSVAGDSLDEHLPEHATFDAAHARRLKALRAVARSGLSVLLLGASGTGKERLARAVHRHSGRSGPFVAVNCGALSPGLLEAELFGHQRGAFTGALTARPGYVRSADGGTLFLDEIGDLPLPAQAALLRVLQEHEVTPLGQTEPVAVDLRVVAATHRDLGSLVERGGFRADLLARLNGFTVELPTLVDRREDLGLIIASILRRLTADPSRVTFTRRATRALFRYVWPMNVRELEKALTSALVLAPDRPIDIDDLPDPVRDALTAAHAPVPGHAREEIDQFRRDRIEALLVEHRGNVTALANALDTSRAQVHRLFARLGIDVATFRR